MLALEPNLNPDLACALLATTSAIVCPYELCLAAIGNAMDNGVELTLDFEVTSIEKADGKYIINPTVAEKEQSTIH
jgi:glycerol-3-phosphate dehydrogenase